MDTLQHFLEAGCRPEELFFITGADAILEILTWRRHEEAIRYDAALPCCERRQPRDRPPPLQRLCPDALVLNYTNPMSILTLAALQGTTMRTVGLCHSIQDNRMSRFVQAKGAAGGFASVYNQTGLYDKYLTEQAIQRLGT